MKSSGIRMHRSGRYRLRRGKLGARMGDVRLTGLNDEKHHRWAKTTMHQPNGSEGTHSVPKADALPGRTGFGDVQRDRVRSRMRQRSVNVWHE